MTGTEPMLSGAFLTPKAINHYFRVAALLFAIAGAVHLYRFVALREFSSFHAVFTLLDPLVAWLMLRRPLWLAYMFPFFAAQQIYAHGALLAQSVRDGGLDAVSAFILAFMPLTAILLFVDRARRAAPAA